MTVAHDDEALPEALAKLDLNLVVAFDALAREQNVTRAAARVGVTQSAMSHALRRLRETIGDPLFVRGRAGLMLTPRAEALRVPLRSGLVTIQRALAGPEPFEPSTSTRRFSLASPDLFDMLMLPPLFKRLQTSAPSADLAVAPLGGGLSARLETGELDVAVLPHVEDLPRADGAAPLMRRTLFRDAFACLMRKDHPALGRSRKTRRRTIGAAELASLSHVLVSPDGEGPGLVDRALARLDLRRRIALRVPSFVAALAVLPTSDLVLTGPTALARAPASSSLVVLRPTLELPDHTVDLVWHERFAHDLGHRWFRELIVDTASATLGDMRPTPRASR